MRAVRRPDVGLGRAAVFFGLLLELLLAIAVASSAELLAPLPLTLLAIALALAARACVVGCYLREDDVVVRSWLRTYRAPRRVISDARPISYSGFATRFSDSRLVSMVALDVVGRAVPYELRFSADTPRRVRASALRVREWLVAPGSVAAG
ncbi:hypothetical protein [Cellulomonas shaoxiangyii]|uniref:PH domain-containing protein n=2 Tax=Cellulomonas shaoxiangyii TaxID=2566013 RepID=A0A4P7SJY4_9CELL|nr:hypothetical protein [Cellulomonas shaoxiangyii]QCB94028.1 hypothetical protein E5225_11075 [Cellulomonas shaoxiangyii]TGY85783.1 hypothetical protein E5226_05110 [Cellulomonas shaoxiangyii]